MNPIPQYEDNDSVPLYDTDEDRQLLENTENNNQEELINDDDNDNDNDSEATEEEDEVEGEGELSNSNDFSNNPIFDYVENADDIDSENDSSQIVYPMDFSTNLLMLPEMGLTYDNSNNITNININNIFYNSLINNMMNDEYSVDEDTSSETSNNN